MKSEKMWMAWHPKTGFIKHSLAETKEATEKEISVYSSFEIQKMKVIKVEIREVE